LSQLLPLPAALARLIKAGVAPVEDFPARIGVREVRVVEIVEADAIIQPVDDPRHWEIAPANLITVNPRDLRKR
jgi:hypothetical protein